MKFGTSMTGSRLVNGSMKLHNEARRKARRLPRQRIGAGVHHRLPGHLATISALLSNKKCVAVIDRNDHASIYDGVRLGQAVGARWCATGTTTPSRSIERFPELAPDEGGFVITDGVFSARARSPSFRSSWRCEEAQGPHLRRRRARARRHRAGRTRDRRALRCERSSRSDGRHVFEVAGFRSAGGWVGERKVLDYIQHFDELVHVAASAALRAWQPPWRRSTSCRKNVAQDQLRKNFTYCAKS